MVASGNFTTIDAVRRQITALGLQTRKGRALTKQTFARMLNNPFYCGWIVSGGNKYRGTHTPLISEELFESVQTRLNVKSTPHARSNEDFPLRGFIKCTCGGALTAGWSKGKMGKHYARYWCWQKECRGNGIAREELELHWIHLLGMMEPTTRILEQLPDIARREWSTRKMQIAKEAEVLNRRMNEQSALNEKGIKAKLNGELAENDFQTIKRSIAEETLKIEAAIQALDAETSTMEALITQTNAQAVNFVQAWRNATMKQKHELQWALFPEGLTYSRTNRFFEPANVSLFKELEALYESLSNVGVPDGI